MTTTNHTHPTTSLQLAAEVIATLADNTALAVAHRIAVLAKSDPAAAANDYRQHVSAMSSEERATFNRYIAVQAASL